VCTKVASSSGTACTFNSNCTVADEQCGCLSSDQTSPTCFSESQTEKPNVDADVAAATVALENCYLTNNCATRDCDACFAQSCANILAYQKYPYYVNLPCDTYATDDLKARCLSSTVTTVTATGTTGSKSSNAEKTSITAFVVLLVAIVHLF